MTLEELNEKRPFSAMSNDSIDEGEKVTHLVILGSRKERRPRGLCQIYPHSGACENHIGFAAWCENCIQAWCDGWIE